ncbi:MAG: AbrB/MazE/SpoVT family DNA-binding domain-containing protein [Candidatus Brocadiales bacterium]
MPFVKVLRHGQITLPKKYREALGIDEGQILEVELKESMVILKPKVLVDKGSTLSPKGERKIKEALGDLRKGRVKKFENVEDLIKDLDS